MKKVCLACNEQFESLYESKNYCTVRCRNRARGRRASSRDKVLLATRSDGLTNAILPYPTREQVSAAIEVVAEGGKEVICVGSIPTLESGRSDVKITLQPFSDPPQWLIHKHEQDIMEMFKHESGSLG